MNNRWAVAAMLVAGLAILVMLVVRTFATSMALVFAVLGLVAVVIARDAFVPDRTDDR